MKRVAKFSKTCCYIGLLYRPGVTLTGLGRMYSFIIDLLKLIKENSKNRLVAGFLLTLA